MVGQRNAARLKKRKKRASRTSDRLEFIGNRVRPSGIALSVCDPTETPRREHFPFGFWERHAETAHVPRARRADDVHAVLELRDGQQHFVRPRPALNGSFLIFFLL